MPTSFQQFALQAMPLNNRSWRARLFRVATGAIEPFYAGVMRVRNFCYDRGVFKTYELGRFTISIGNITTGGTGKTPAVIWLADQLRKRGKHPAILLRGYGSTAKHPSDESLLLRDALKIPVQPNPSRVDGAVEVLKSHADVDVFILDDAFQHRRAKRDFNLVLISATNPFGEEHVLPRGLLREPLAGIGRADAFLVTRCSLVEEAEMLKIDNRLRQQNAVASVYHCDHHIGQVFFPVTNETLPIDSLAGKKIFVATGIGDPSSFVAQVRAAGCLVVGSSIFSDHHAYSTADTKRLADLAVTSKAEHILTTEKDWVKIKSVIANDAPKEMFSVADLELVFRGREADSLLTQIIERM